MLALPASAADVLGKVVMPALTNLLPSRYDSPESRVLLLAFGAQETGFRTRLQIGGGPGHGFWQNEPEGVADVIENQAVDRDAHGLCSRCAVSPVGKDAYWALLTDDAFACGIARLMLFCDPHPLPMIGDVAGAFESYIRIWRPGAYSRGTPEQQAEIKQRFADNYIAALSAVQLLAGITGNVETQAGKRGCPND